MPDTVKGGAELEPRAVPEQPPEGFDFRFCWPTQWAVYLMERDWRTGAFRKPETLTMKCLGTWEIYPTEARARDVTSHLDDRFFVGPALWEHRENLRSRDGTYTHPRFAETQWWQNRSDTLRRHYAHVSLDDPSMIAFTESDQKGARDRQTRMRVGRYLTRFFSDVLSEREIAFIAKWQTTGTLDTGFHDEGKYPLRFAETGSEITDVYANGPASCMQGEDAVRVYGAGDLAVAYLANETDNGKRSVTARALVWPARKHVGRIYPTPDSYYADEYVSRDEAQAAYDALLNRLLAMGYTTEDQKRGGFNGARLKKIDAGGYGSRYVMPYLDRGYMVNDGNNHFTMHINGQYLADSTDGEIEIEDRLAHCDNCEDSFDPDDAITVYTRWSPSYGARGAQTWCLNCAEDHAFYCVATHKNYGNDSGVPLADGEIVVQDWADHHCYVSDHSGDTFDPDNDAQVEMANGEVWAQSEFETDGFTCRVTGDNHPDDEMHPSHDWVHRDVTDDELRDAGIVTECSDGMEPANDDDAGTVAGAA